MLALFERKDGAALNYGLKLGLQNSGREDSAWPAVTVQNPFVAQPEPPRSTVDGNR
jgi:hypothetical protein